MTFSHDELRRLIAIARDATLGGTFEERMSLLSEKVAPLVPWTHATAAVFDPVRNEIPNPSYLFTRNHDPALSAQYAAYYHKIDDARAHATAHLGEAIRYGDFYPDRSFGEDEFSAFLQFSKTRYGVGVNLQLGPGQAFTYCLHREKGRDFSDREVELLRLIYPEIGRAAAAAIIADRIAGAPWARSPREGVLLLDAKGDLVQADERGRDLARTIQGGPGALAAIARELGAAWIERRTLPAGRSAVRATFVRSGDKTAVFLALEVLDPLETVARRFGLTARERDVAREALRGLENRQIAEVLGLSPITVKQHLSRAFRKVGVRRRSELVARILAEK